MMNTNERDTHFKEFARLLYEELAQWQEPMLTTHLRCNLKQEQADAIALLIARRAYDLAEHVLDSIRWVAYDVPDIDDGDIPDMASFPEPPQTKITQE
jgi:hypothetical protein